MAFNTSLHGLRGLAALSVLLFHWKANFPALAQSVQSVELAGTRRDLFYWVTGGGIHWFFVLSGYQIASTMWHMPLSGQSVWQFWRRRFLRIYPMVWLHLAILVVVTFAILQTMSFLKWNQLLGNATLWFNLMPRGVQPYNGVMWTLTVEVMFYIALPLILMLYRSKGIWWVIGASLLTSLAYRATIWNVYEEALTYNAAHLRTLPGLLFLFAAGFAINHFSPEPDRMSTYAMLAMIVTALVVWRYPVQDADKAPWLAISWDLVMGLLIALMVSLLIQPVAGLRWLSTRPLVWLGNLSLGIYLWHLPALRLLPRVVPGNWNTPEGSALALAICLTVSFSLAHLGYWLIEQPMRNRTKKSLRSSTTPDNALPT
jgi:peptidoglycan/LPS O-acetylase OafA/YrhL